MPTKTQRARFEQWLLELTGLPTAAGKEERVIAWIENWVKARRNLRLQRDKAGNLIISIKGRAPKNPPPLYITAHMDHPAFVVTNCDDDREVELEFRGGVHDPYFDDAPLHIFDADDRQYTARITHLDTKAKPFKRITARLSRAGHTLKVGDVGRWDFRGKANTPTITRGRLHTHVCDDLAALVAALCTLDLVRNRADCRHVALLLTRAEEVGFIGTIAACKHRTLPKSARLVCLENSRSFPESPIGGGPILRVGDRLSVFEPNLTNQIGALMLHNDTKKSKFPWQRKLMPGGACEATAFSSYGYQATCICLPLGNYHNMSEIDEVLAGKRPARVRPETIAVNDFHGMIDMLVLIAKQLDSGNLPPLTHRLDKLLADHGHVLDG
jgi:putative aminopeptidase FrvX